MLKEAKLYNPGINPTTWLNHHSIQDNAIKSKLRNDLDKAMNYNQ